MIYALSQVSTLPTPFDTDIEEFAASECHAVDVWFTKLEQFLQEHTVEDVQRLLEQNDVAIPVASFQGGLLDSQGESRQAAWKLFAERLKLSTELAIETVVVACDVSLLSSSTDLQRVQASLTQAAELAATHGVRLALEFQAAARLGNNLQSALALIEQTAHPSLGVCLDAFHFETGPSKVADLSLLTNENLFVVQLSDLAEVARELASDSDRILPGDGELDLASLRNRLTAIDYRGVVTVELMNPQIWQVPARQFADVAMNALKRTLA